jgi:hypothetical protein
LIIKPTTCLEKIWHSVWLSDIRNQENRNESHEKILAMAECLPAFCPTRLMIKTKQDEKQICNYGDWK